jgi:hypothetical protein
MDVTADKDMVKSGSMSASEVNAAHLLASARPKKKNGRLAKFGRHTRSCRSLCRRSTGVEDYDNVNSRCSEMYDNTTFSLDLDESVGLMVQHPPKKQVTTKTDKKGKTVTLVTCYAVSPEERIELEYYCLADIWGEYLRKVTLPLTYGPPHPVKATLENQVETWEVPPSNAGFQLWKFLIRNNHHPVLPWIMTTNSTNRGNKKALPWQPQ